MTVQRLLRRARSRPIVVTVLLAVLLLSMILSGFVAFRIAHGSDSGTAISTPAPIAPYVFHGDVSQLPTTPPAPLRHQERAGPTIGAKTQIAPDPVPIQGQPPASDIAPAPGPGGGGDEYAGSFAGLDEANWGAGYPPDMTGDAGPEDYIQAVNTSIGIFRKSDGSRIAAFTFNALWGSANTGTACDNGNDGAPTVIWDSMADRWFVADLAFGGDGTAPPFYECIAVSQTGDPVKGGWYLYPIRTDDASHPWFADYPRMGIWPTALFMTANMYVPTAGGAFQEVRAWAFDRADMEAGAGVHSVVVDLGTASYFSMLPATMRLATGSPPDGRDEFFVDESETQYAFDVWQFHVDFTGGTSGFSGPTQVSQASYSIGSATVTSTGNSLDTLGDRLMTQAQYVQIGGNSEALWVSHSVRTGDASSPEGIQWADIDVTGGTINTTPINQQIYGDLNGDGVNRWMGSLALDQYADMALGYSVTSPTVMPGIAYAGSLAGDPSGPLTQTETTLVSGTGSQTNTCGGVTCTSWGDSSAMTLDPDNCVFWYTNEYYLADGGDWQTRILSMRLNPNCPERSANTTVTPSPVSASFGSTVNLSATLSWQPGTVNRPLNFPVVTSAISGATLTFTLNGTIAGTAVTNTSGVATLSNVTLASNAILEVSYGGDGAFFAPSSGNEPLILANNNQTITFLPIANHIFGDPDFPLGATASSGFPVSYSASGDCVIAADNVDVHITDAGSCMVTASQMGGPGYNPAPNVTQTFSIAKANQTISFAPIANHTFGDPDFAVSATASSGYPIFYVAVGSCTVAPFNGVVHITDGGSCTVGALQFGSNGHGGPDDYNPASASQTFTVALQGTSTAITNSANVAVSGGSALLSAHLTADGGMPISGRMLMLTLGSHSCSAGPTDSSGNASCTVTGLNSTTDLGPQTETAVFAGDAGTSNPADYSSSQATLSTLGYAGLGQGSFVIGNLSAGNTSATQTFWGAQWGNLNSLSGGSAPSSFKGYALNVSSNPPVCGGTWSTDPGNSSTPPAGPLPTYMAVIVVSNVSKSGSEISGNIVHIVILRTNSGYANDPGHAGTGMIVGTVC